MSYEHFLGFPNNISSILSKRRQSIQKKINGDEETFIKATSFNILYVFIHHIPSVRIHKYVSNLECKKTAEVRKCV